MLQQVEIVFDLLFIKLGGQHPEVQGNGSYMPTVIIKSAGAATEDRDVALKAIE